MPFLSVNGAKLHVHGSGEGPALLFVHPPFIGSHIFTYLVNDLSRDHRTVTMDLRGHGLSPAGDAALTLPLLAEDIRAVLDRLGIDRAYLCGYSAGALPVLQALLANPERYAGAVLLSGCSELSDSGSRLRMKAACSLLRLRLDAAVSFAVSWGNADSRLAFDNLRGEAGEGDGRRWREYAEACLSASYTRDLPRIAQQILLVCGAADEPYIRHARELSRLLPAGELTAVGGAPHQLPGKSAAETATAMRRWLAAREGRPYDAGALGIAAAAGVPEAAREGERVF